jgi:hypothetical protein
LVYCRQRLLKKKKKIPIAEGPWLRRLLRRGDVEPSIRGDDDDGACDIPSSDTNKRG